MFPLPTSQQQPHDLLLTLYHTYRHTLSPTLQGNFFSPTCLQICRPIPSYSATSRAQIVQYLRDAASASVTKSSDPLFKPVEGENVKVRGVYTIRPLTPIESLDFGTAEVTGHVGLLPDDLREKAKKEKWIGMRVDLWDEGVPVEGSVLVKVQYWWRWEDVSDEEGVGLEEEPARLEGDEEGMGWRQCLHDIMYIGERNGSEGRDGEGSEGGLEVRDLGGRVG